MSAEPIPPLNLDAVGKRYEFTKSFTWKDAALYAIAVGAQRDELEYVYERDLKLVPSYGAIFSVEPVIVNDMVGRGVFGLDAAPKTLLSLGNDYYVNAPLEIRDQVLRTEAFVSGIYDRGEGRGAQINVQSETYDDTGRLVYTNVERMVGLQHGGFGGEAPAHVSVEIPDRDPDAVRQQLIPENQAVLYRLTGDTYPVHIDFDVARGYGFPAPILHGLCTFGFACRALVATFFPGEPERLTSMNADYSKPVITPANIETRMWQVGSGEAVFEVANTDEDAVVIRRGRLAWK